MDHFARNKCLPMGFIGRGVRIIMVADAGRIDRPAGNFDSVMEEGHHTRTVALYDFSRVTCTVTHPVAYEVQLDVFTYFQHFHPG